MFVLVTLIFVGSFSICGANIYDYPVRPEYYEQILDNLFNSYENLLNYIYKYKKYMNLDGVFGLVLAQAQLELATNKTILGEFLTPPPGQPERAVERTKKLIKEVKEEISSSLSKLNTILNPSLWMNNNGFSKRKLRLVQIPLWDRDAHLSYMYTGPPSEEESDKCIMYLIRSGSPQKVHECDDSNSACEEIFYETERVNGYPLTHILLYWQVHAALKCEPFPYLDKLKDRICERILSEAKLIELHGFQPMFRDLFMEQLLLCGLEGYTEFLNTDWIDEILKWQTHVGCFGPRTFRRKRESTKMPYGCESHTTGVGAAWLGVTIRSLLSLPIPNKSSYSTS